MSLPVPPPASDPDPWIDAADDPEPPDLTDLDHPERESGTDIVPAATDEQEPKPTRQNDESSRR